MLEVDKSHIVNLEGNVNVVDDTLQQSIYDFFPGLVYVYDADNKQLRFVNKRITEALGYSYDDIRDWNHDLGKLVFKEDIALVQNELEKFHELKENDTHGYKCRLNHKDGDYVHFRVTGKVLRRNEKGKAASILFIAQDISEQMQASAESMIFQELVDDTENLLQFATWRWDARTDEIKWSNGIYALLNHPPKDRKKITGDFFIKHIIPEDRKRVDTLYKNAVKSMQELLSYEYTIRTHDRETKVLRTNIKFRYADGKIISAFGINRDITEKARMLNDLMSYREMVMEKESFLGQGTLEVDFSAGATFWSDGMYFLFGYDPEKEKGHLKIDEDIYRKHMSSDDFERVKVKLLAALEKESSFVLEFQITTALGEIRQLEIFGKIVRDKAKKPIRVVGTSRDVTQMHKYERELERKIAELNRSNKDLEDFAYVASHDMHEPLRKVHSFADRLKVKFGNGLEEEAKDYLDRILVATQNARLMIDGLMEYSRLSRNTQRFEKTNLDNVVAEVMTDLELKIEETKARIDVGQLPELEVSRIQIKQLLNNILTNAIKFRKTGVDPVVVIKSKKLSRNEVDQLNLDTRLTYYKLVIKDNGIGFEEEYEERIFQMFQRLNGTNEYPGSGIGLALCKKITENHQGMIFAKGVLGEGTAISVILPVMQPSSI